LKLTAGQKFRTLGFVQQTTTAASQANVQTVRNIDGSGLQDNALNNFHMFFELKHHISPVPSKHPQCGVQTVRARQEPASIAGARPRAP
jgi:hypothetical protein